MAFAFAGQWGPEPVVDRYGNAIYSATFRVLTTAGAEATVYTDRTKATTVSQPLDVDGEANATFYAAPGRYTLELTAGGSVTSFPVGVVPDAEDVEPADDVAAQFAATVQVKVVTDPQFAGGAVGDGATDDTAAIQAAIAAAETAGGGLVWFPEGNYLITSKLDIAKAPGLRLVGGNKHTTKITQGTDNIPIFDMGAAGTSELHSWAIVGLSFTYSNVQPAANTSAVPVLFSAMAYRGVLDDLVFIRGAYGIEVATGVGAPWSCSFDDLTFGGGLSRGAINTLSGSNAVPNNRWGRIFIDATAMEETYLRLRGVNTTIDTIEVIAATNGRTLLEVGSTSVFTIGAIKLENGTYNANRALIDVPADGVVTIGQVMIYGNAMDFAPASGKVAILSLGGGGGTVGAFAKVGYVSAAATTLSGTCVLASVAKASDRVQVARANLQNGWVDDAAGRDAEVEWIGANDFDATGSPGSPVRGRAGSRFGSWLLDAASTEQVQATFIVPAAWKSVHFDLYWSNAGTGTGDVVWSAFFSERADGEDLTLGDTTLTDTAYTAPAQDVLKVTRMKSSQVMTPGELAHIRVARSGALAGDTLGNDAHLIGVKLTRAYA